MSKIIILDDEKRRHDGLKKLLIGHDLTHAYICQQAISSLTREKFDVAFLDHDLHAELDGRDLCRWMVANPDRCPQKIFIHSWNHFRALDMEAMLKPLGIKIMVRPIPGAAEDPPDIWCSPPYTKDEEVRTNILIKAFAERATALIES